MGEQLLRDAAAVLQPGFVNDDSGRVPDWVRRALTEDGLGGVAYYGRNIAATPERTGELSAALRAENPHVLVAVDEEGGDVTRLDVATGSAFPGNYALGYVDDPELTETVARQIGRSLWRAGINLNYAPDADLNTNPDNPVIGTRSFGSDPGVAARNVAAYVRGLQGAGVAGCAKHFPGHGDTAVDSHHGLPLVQHSEQEWAKHLAPFRAAIEAGVKSVMTAHILAPRYDPEFPSTMSRKVLVDLLRGELGFTGLVVTDGIEMAAIADTFGIAEGTVLALAAGVDAVCVGGGLRDECDYLMLRDALVDAVREGRLPAERLHEAATRVRELGAWAAAQRATVEGTHAAGGDAGAGGSSVSASASVSGSVSGSASASVSSNGVPASVAAASSAASASADSDDAEQIGLNAALRAVTVSGAPLVPLTGPVSILEFVPLANNAAGNAVPWGLSPVLSELPAGSVAARFVEPGSATSFAGDDDTAAALAAVRPRLAALPYTPAGVSEAVAAAAGRPLVLVVRDAHRHAWMASAVAAVTTVRPDAIVVEMGIAYGRGEKSGGATLIATHGAALVSGLAVARLLTEGTV
ncbi:glycoside hydrolase family 3 protein [Catenulispora rubra]|uniref:glycoside hydrolase family 3 protein n=1 Tax=Catenulispora rubra TaxID=280293 RepID=UPI001892182F|nr:glycoside hydrolase family 3 N-terminal domain-containing protein [Catenulispora rubra]